MKSVEELWPPQEREEVPLEPRDENEDRFGDRVDRPTEAIEMTKDERDALENEIQWDDEDLQAMQAETRETLRDFVKAIGLCESKNVAESVYGMTKIIEMLLGPEGEADLVNFIKKKNGGKCSQQNMSDAILEIFSKIKEDKEGKNSETSPE